MISANCKGIRKFLKIMFCLAGKSLMLVALLGLAIFYIYALILFAFYREWLWSASNGRHCRTIYECFVSVLHHGLVEGPYTVGSVSELMWEFAIIEG